MRRNYDEIRKRYMKNVPVYRRTCSNIKEALEIFLKEKGISYLTITSRVKEYDSFLEKISRKEYKNPFEENEDFCGIRVILYYTDDIDQVQEVIRKEFDIQLEENKSATLDTSEFGYRSHHFVVKFKQGWLSTPNYRGLEHMKVEIQLRTVLMHTWAEIEHGLGYKNKDLIPQKLKRKLSLISAKLEDADEQFQDLKKNIEKYNEMAVKASV